MHRTHVAVERLQYECGQEQMQNDDGSVCGM